MALIEGRPPVKRHPYACGMSAFIGCMAALREREHSGIGQIVEVAEMEAQATIVNFTRTEYTGLPSSRHWAPAPAVGR